MSARYTMSEMVDLSKEAGQAVDAFIKTAAVLERHQAKLEAGRRATDAEKETIKQYLNGLNGELNSDLPTSEILAGANVRKVQGTASFASRELKRQLLTHDPAPAAVAAAAAAAEESKSARGKRS